MNNKERSKISLKVFEKVYHEYPVTQEIVKVSTTNICEKENVSPNKVLFLFCFSLLL